MADNLSVSISGADNILSKLVRIPIIGKFLVDGEVRHALEGTLADSQDACPYDDTNTTEEHLRDTGHIEYTGSSSGSVVYGTDHCWYIELGTYKMAAQPFLGPAFEKNTQDLRDNLSTMLPKLVP